MGLSCARYRAYDWFKQTWLAARLFYSGLRFAHYTQVTITGKLVDCAHGSSDGDLDVDLLIDGPPFLKVLSKQWHLEITPCQPAALRAQVANLNIGQRIAVTGIRTYDPSHHIGPKKFAGGGWEIHPVTAVKILDESLEAT